MRALKRRPPARAEARSAVSGRLVPSWPVRFESEDQRFFFVHIMKTAGTTFLRRVRRELERSEVFPGPRDKDKVTIYYDIDRVLGLEPQRQRKLRFVNGHYPYVTSQMMAVPFTTVTILRHPVERTISYLKHCKRRNAEHHDLPLEAIYEDPYRYPGLIHDHQTKVFAFTEDDAPESVMDVMDVDDDRLAIAKANLEQVDLLGVQEHLDEFFDLWQRRFGLDPEPGPDVNVSTEDWSVPDAFRRFIEEDNARDMELYEHARQLYAARRER